MLLAKYGTREAGGAGLRLALQIAGEDMRAGVAYAFPTALTFTFFGRLSQKLGPGVLTSWMLGRYRSPA